MVEQVRSILLAASAVHSLSVGGEHFADRLVREVALVFAFGKRRHIGRWRRRRVVKNCPE